MTDWFGAYTPYPKKLVVPKSFTHPAKMPPSLTFKILARLEELGLKRGGKIIDPFCGIGGTLLCAGLLGYETFGMELEPKFYDIIASYDCPGFTKKEWLRFYANSRVGRLNYQNFHVCPVCSGVGYERGSYQIPFREAHHYIGNIEKNRHKFKHVPVVKQGDSTKDLLSAFGGEKFAAVVGSPAFAEQQTGGGIAKKGYKGKLGAEKFETFGRRNIGFQNQGRSPGQMANLPEGDFDSVISSPPYADALSLQGGRQRAQAGAGNAKAGKDDLKMAGSYGKEKGQIGELPEGDFQAVISSPPYGEIRMDGGKIAKEREGGMRPYTGEKPDAWRTTRDQRNLGNNSPETYWSACRRIYFNCFLLLKPGGFIALVVKDFVRKKKRVPLCDQTWELLQAVGFEPVERNRAWLVEERAAATFFDANYSVKRERKSFFRRLAEKKGSPKIDFEEVLICRK